MELLTICNFVVAGFIIFRFIRTNRTGHFLTAVFLYKIMKTVGFFCAIFLTSFNDFCFKNCYTWSIMLYYMLLEVFTNESQKL